VNSYGLNGQEVGVPFPAEVRISSAHVVHTVSKDHPTSYPMGIGGFVPWGKAAGREAVHAPPASAEVKNM
jgi:hypothetical protein